MPEFYIKDDFTTPTECLSEALGSIQGLYEDKRNAELLIDSYKYAIELLTKEEATDGTD